MIVGGVTRVIPLTGVTLPFVSYGGSSIVANFVLLALLLLVSDRARQAGAPAMNAPIVRLFGFVRRAVRRARGFARRAGRCSAPSAARQPEQPARAARGAADQARRRSAPPTARCWPRSRAARRATRYDAPLSDRRRCSPTPVGYSYTTARARRPRAYYNDPLTGRRTELIGALDSLLGHARRRRRPAARRSTRKAQQVAIDALAGRKGAVVALDVKTGAVLRDGLHAVLRPERPRPGDVPAARPTTRTRRCQPRDAGRAIRRARRSRRSPPRRRSTPASTRRTRRVSGKNGKVISGVAAEQLRRRGLRRHHAHRRADATRSTPSGPRSARSSAKDTMAEYMERFGFYERAADRLPRRPDGRRAGERGPNGKLLPPTLAARSTSAAWRSARASCSVTPLQMATVAQTIANGGVRMEPRLVREGRRPRRAHGRRDRCPRRPSA